MARMHSGKKGQSGSKKPAVIKVSPWVKLSPKEVELLIGKMAKEGKSASQIGLHLRDNYGVPDVKALCKKTISQIIDDKKLTPEVPDDLMALFKKYTAVRKHIEENNHDITAKRGLILTESKINRLVKYYKATGKMDEDWKFDPERVKFYSE